MRFLWESFVTYLIFSSALLLSGACGAGQGGGPGIVVSCDPGLAGESLAKRLEHARAGRGFGAPSAVEVLPGAVGVVRLEFSMNRDRYLSSLEIILENQGGVLVSSVQARSEDVLSTRSWALSNVEGQVLYNVVESSGDGVSAVVAFELEGEQSGSPQLITGAFTSESRELVEILEGWCSAGRGGR